MSKHAHSTCLHCQETNHCGVTIGRHHQAAPNAKSSIVYFPFSIDNSSFFFEKIRERKDRLLSKPRSGGVRPRCGALERRRLKEAGVCCALPKPLHGHFTILLPSSIDIHVAYRTHGNVCNQLKVIADHCIQLVSLKFIGTQ